MSLKEYAKITDFIEIEDLIKHIFQKDDVRVGQDIVKIDFRSMYGFIRIKKRLGNQEFKYRFMLVETMRGFYNIYELDITKLNRIEKSTMILELFAKHGYQQPEISEFLDVTQRTIHNAVSVNKHKLVA